MVEGKKKRKCRHFFSPSVKTYLTFTYNTQRHHHERCIFPLKLFFFLHPPVCSSQKIPPSFVSGLRGHGTFFFRFVRILPFFVCLLGEFFCVLREACANCTGKMFFWGGVSFICCCVMEPQQPRYAVHRHLHRQIITHFLVVVITGRKSGNSRFDIGGRLIFGSDELELVC
jgi:hypothetical protein